MSESNYASSHDSTDSILNSLTTNASPVFPTSPNCARIKFKKDALEHVDYIKEYQHDPKYKTELCKSWTETGFCAYGNKCRFAHGKHELFDKVINCKKYKQKECMSFFKNQFCCYGSRCHFKHEERDLNEIDRSFYSYLLQMRIHDSQDNISEVEAEVELVSRNSSRLPIFNAISNFQNNFDSNEQNVQNLPKSLPDHLKSSSKASRYLKSIENYSYNTKFTLNYYNLMPLF